MDANLAPRTSNHGRWFRQLALLSASACAVLSCCGCNGKSLVDDNPVFTAAPPRKSLVNKSSLATADAEESATVIQSVSFSTDDGPQLLGNTVVAQVNGTPIFVDDLVGSIRLALDAQPEISAEDRQKILRAQIQGRLDNFIEQEIVVQALNQAVPDDRQAMIDESLEEPFQQVLANIKKDRGLQTDKELDAALASEGLSIDLLRESFLRIQKVQGYLSTIATPPSTAERFELVDYYKTHQADFTTPERIRWQEIIVRFNQHGGREGAEKIMIQIVERLQQDDDFAQLATEFSDALSAEKRGDMGWLERGGLADKDLEAQLFELAAGQMTKVYVRDDSFELYRVVDHQQQQVTPFQEVQDQIEQQLKQQRQKQARDKAMQDLRENATVVTMFDKEQQIKN